MKEPFRVEVAGVPLRCKHCDGDAFVRESAAFDRLALGGLAQLEGPWGHDATIYVCSACGFLHWFFAMGSVDHERTACSVEEAAESEAKDEPLECLACGQRIPAGESACPACGWSWTRAPEG
jgi:predicted RNA-binding Zn-ribbon protein involved in translation (DUF1610 family)